VAKGLSQSLARRADDRNHLANAVANLAQALLMTGDWDGVEAELAQALDGDGLADSEARRIAQRLGC
jgi:hypothetical protein